MRIPRLMLVAMAFVGHLSAQTVTEFLIVKLNDHYQTTSGSTSPGYYLNPAITNAYGMFVEIRGTSLGGTNTFTAPGGSAVNISTVKTGALVYENAHAYATSGELNTAFANGDYSMTINTSGGPVNITALSLTGDAYPVVPMITGGTWSNGKLLIDPTQNYTLNFSSFTGFSASTDKIFMSIDGSGSDDHSDESSTAVTSFLIAGGSFVLANGATTSAELVFLRGVDSDNTSIAGAPGIAGYASIVSFQIQAVPEPSTYAALAGTFSLAGVIIMRRRRSSPVHSSPSR